MAYADDVNLLGNSIDTIHKNTETLTDATKGVLLKENTEKTQYMLLSRHQNTGQNHDIKIARFRYFGMTATNQNFSGGIRRRINSGKACYRFVCNVLSFRLSKNVNIRVHKTIIWSVVLHGCETWSLILREEHRLRVFENRVL
jgi:hypothetical protein